MLNEQRKSDGSPVTEIEMEAEEFAKKALFDFCPEAVFLGEESGVSSGHDKEILMVIDPIDGTWSFLSGFDTFSITLSILNKKKPLFSVICSPSTGDFSFRIGENPSKIFQFPIAGEHFEILKLPVIPVRENQPILVNAHPSTDCEKHLFRMYHLWKKKQVALVKSVSGSPSLLIIEAAKGGGIYFNAWRRGKTMPFDLIPGLHIINGAGGSLVGLAGDEIDPWRHEGLFLAGLNYSNMNFLAEELSEV